MPYRHHVYIRPAHLPPKGSGGNAPPPTGLMLDSKVGSVTTTEPLAKGQPYTLTVDGTYTLWNKTLDKGTPEPVAMYPTAGSRSTTEVGVDAETLFAEPTADSIPLSHFTYFQIDLGGGYVHVEPVGGPYDTPQPGHSYTYHVTGQGMPASFRIADIGKTPDNYGALRIRIA